MRPIDQSRISYEDGDCLRACIASILELSLEDVPAYVGANCYGKWTGLERELHWYLSSLCATATLHAFRENPDDFHPFARQIDVFHQHQVDQLLEALAGCDLLVAFVEVTHFLGHGQQERAIDSP